MRFCFITHLGLFRHSNESKRGILPVAVLVEVVSTVVRVEACVIFAVVPPVIPTIVVVIATVILRGCVPFTSPIVRIKIIPVDVFVFIASYFPT